MGWDRVRGHEALVEGFRRVLARGRLAHAYLFVGPPGVGKKLFAVELARALLCDAPPAPLTACDACPSCVQVGAYSHPDFLVARRPEERHEFPVEEMRKLLANFALKSARGKGKVYVIDDADDLNEESANAFLKSLEEPPPRSLLILIGISPEQQLTTIVSRCQVVRFGPVPDAVVEGALVQAGVEDEALRARLVRLAAGSPGRALSLASPELWEFRGRLLAGLMQSPIDSPGLASAWMAFVEGAGRESAPKRERAALVVGLLADLFCDALAVNQGADPRRTGPEDAAAVRSLAGRFSPEQLLDLIERCLEAERHIGQRVQLELALEAVLDALAQRLVG